MRSLTLFVLLIPGLAAADPGVGKVLGGSPDSSAHVVQVCLAPNKTSVGIAASHGIAIGTKVAFDTRFSAYGFLPPSPQRLKGVTSRQELYVEGNPVSVLKLKSLSPLREDAIVALSPPVEGFASNVILYERVGSHLVRASREFDEFYLWQSLIYGSVDSRALVGASGPALLDQENRLLGFVFKSEGQNAVAFRIDQSYALRTAIRSLCEGGF